MKPVFHLAEKLRMRPGRRGRAALRGLARPLAAVLLPGPAFLAAGRPRAGLACFALQLSIVGWLPAAVWAAVATHQMQAGRERRRALADRLRPG